MLYNAFDQEESFHQFLYIIFIFLYKILHMHLIYLYDEQRVKI